MRIDSELDRAYLDWLYFQLVSPHEHHPSDTYRQLLQLLYQTQFYILIDKDENRAEDGATLRDRFVVEEGIAVDADDEEWFAMDCSVLELIFGVAERLAFETDKTVKSCFWELLNNLGIASHNDAWFDSWATVRIESKLHIFMERLYKYNGEGGLFPLKHPREDQSTVEIWYQMAAYLDENSSID